MHLGLGSLIILRIVAVAIFGGPQAVTRAIAGLGCLALVVIVAGALLYWFLSVTSQPPMPIHQVAEVQALASLSAAATPATTPQPLSTHKIGNTEFPVVTSMADRDQVPVGKPYAYQDENGKWQVMIRGKSTTAD